MDWKQLGPYLVPALIVVFLVRRLITNAPRKVNPGRLFILPAIIGVAVILMFAQSPMPTPLWIAGFAVALVLGAGVGFLTTHHQEFSIDPETGEVTSRSTPFGTLLVVALFAARFGLKYVMTGGSNPYGAPAAHPGPDFIGWTDAGLLFSTGLVFARAITTWFHARPLLEAHKAQQSISGNAAPGQH